MGEVYRKFGRSVRQENDVVVRIEEAGEANEDGAGFSCHPIARTVELPAIDEEPLHAIVREIRSLIRPPLAIERLVVSEGVAEHQFEELRWRDSTRRIHLAIAHRSIRALIDEGDFDLDDVRQIAEALPRAGSEQKAPSRIRLAPNVAAALLPSLVAIAPPNIRIAQTAGGVDGKGQPVEAHPQTRVWPNWYRPSYRVRPIRSPFHLRATCEVTKIDDDLPRAIALLAPPEGLLLRVLCVERDKVFPSTVRVARIDTISAGAKWYPYGAGSFGSEMML